MMMILLCLFQPKGCDLMYNEHPKETTSEHADTGDQGGCEAVPPQGGHQKATGQTQEGAQGAQGVEE